MRRLEEMILQKGRVLPGNILKVDSFLNHQLDVGLLDEVAGEFFRLFREDGVEKVLTLEVSGIAVAALTALKFGVPMVFAKKTVSANMSEDRYVSRVFSYTKNREYEISAAKEFLLPGERVLIVDDFLANGKALEGLLDLLRQAGSVPVGAAIVIEKGFQGGGDRLRGQGLRVESAAVVEAMEGGRVVFRSAGPDR
mgnify:CR=1 FL=1